jgi:hypothetical protein
MEPIDIAKKLHEKLFCGGYVNENVKICPAPVMTDEDEYLGKDFSEIDISWENCPISLIIESDDFVVIVVPEKVIIPDDIKVKRYSFNYSLQDPLSFLFSTCADAFDERGINV